MSAKRFFQVVDPKTGETFGRYTGSNPSKAANKAATSQLSGNRSNKIDIYLRESTQNSPHKLYAYRITRKKLSTPKIISIKGKEIEYQY